MPGISPYIAIGLQAAQLSVDIAFGTPNMYICMYHIKSHRSLHVNIKILIRSPHWTNVCLNIGKNGDMECSLAVVPQSDNALVGIFCL